MRTTVSKNLDRSAKKCRKENKRHQEAVIKLASASNMDRWVSTISIPMSILWNMQQ
jgi:hypothetical protein